MPPTRPQIQHAVLVARRGTRGKKERKYIEAKGSAASKIAKANVLPGPGK